MPPVPNTPEPLRNLQDRYHKAVAYIYSVDSIREGAIRPGEIAANVFDFEDGLRLIISRECCEGFNGTVIHFTASFPSDCQIANEMRSKLARISKDTLFWEFINSVPGRFAELSGDHRKAVLVGVSSGAIPHWVIEESC
jgi:hypothetical protein